MLDEAEFDRFADEYHALHTDSIRLSGESPDYFARYKIEAISRVLKRAGKPPQRILDFGGGVGNSIGHLREFFPHAEIVLADPSQRSLDIARARHPGKAVFQKLYGVENELPEETFDVVFVACVFHHIPEADHPTVLGRLASALKPGGSLFIFEHNPLNPLTRKVVRDCEFDEGVQLIQARNLRQILSSIGMPQPRTRYTFFFPNFLAKLRWLEDHLAFLPLGGQYFVHSVKNAG